MKVKYPLKCDIVPKKIEKGMNWIKLKLLNIGTKRISDLEVNLNTTDSYFINIPNDSYFVLKIDRDEKSVVIFKINARANAEVYATVNAILDGERFFWESPFFLMKVGEQVAELANMFIMAHPRTIMDKSIKIEATVIAHHKLEEKKLKLEFWQEKPSGTVENIAKFDLDSCAIGEETILESTFEPDDQGVHKLSAYLFAEKRLIGHKIDYIIVSKDSR